MSQQRVHKSTLDKAKKLKDRINKDREIMGLKKVTMPDIYESAIDFLIDVHSEARELIKGVKQ